MTEKTKEDSKIEKKKFSEIAVYPVSWGISIFLFTLFFLFTDIDKQIEIPTISYYFLILGILTGLFPFLQKVKFAKIFEIEKSIKESKKELSESKKDFAVFRGEMRQMVSVLSTNINTIGNLSNTVNINLPEALKLKEENEKIEETIDKQRLKESTSIFEEFLEDEDTIMSLARLRIQMEYLIQDLLKSENIELKHLSLYKQFRLLYGRFPELMNFEQSFKYVTQICNAAVHAKPVTENQAKEVINLGSKIIANLKYFLQQVNKTQ